VGVNIIKLDEFNEQLLSELKEQFDNNDDFLHFLEGEAFQKLLIDTGDEMAESLATGLLKNSEELLQTEKQARIGFEKRNQERWLEGFDLIEKLISLCCELGDATKRHLEEHINEVGNRKASAVITLHARCARVANEVFALMRCGFADGAYARWRTMHELNVTCNFIARASEATAERYHHA